MVIKGKDVNFNNETLTYGMVGGGEGSFIGDVHRKAAKFDGKIELVAGCFSRDYDKTLVTGKGLGLDEERIYKDYQQMAKEEGAKEDKIDFVSIVTPNYAHYDIAKAFLENGINIVCDKPLTFSVEEAEELASLASEKDLLICVTYSYSGFPMVKQAREMIKNGEIGEIRMVMGEYPQGWLATKLEDTGQRQAAWRCDPKMAGISNCLGDIGSHIENTVSYMTGLEIESLCAKLDKFGPDRPLDDNAQLMLKYKGGASGVFWSSQIAIGYDNALKVRIFGTKGAIEWEVEKGNYLKVAYHDQPAQILSRGRDELYPLAAEKTRIPAGHPEGYYEAFANIYSNWADALQAKKAGKSVTGEEYDFPTVKEGIAGVKFINLCVESSKKGAVWLEYK